MTLDSRDISIIAQNAGTTAGVIYTHVEQPDTGGFDGELYDAIRTHIFQGVIALVDEYLARQAFPGAQPVNVTQTPAYQAAGGPPVPQQTNAMGPPQNNGYQQPPQHAPPPAPPSPPPAAPAGGVQCHRCGAPMNQVRNKRNPKAPDLKCSAGGWDRNSQQEWGCQGAAWVNNGQINPN